VREHALEVLEFPRVLERISARCASDLGREALLARRPSLDLAEVVAALGQVAAARDLHAAHPTWAPAPPPDARRPLRTLGVEGGVLEPEELLRILRLLEASAAVHDGLLAHLPPGEMEHPLRPFLSQCPHLRDPIRRLARVVEEDGSLSDGASPVLRGIRQKIRAARVRIVRRLESYVASLPERIRVPDASVSLRDDRYVIQVRREGRSEVGGVIHGDSASGATLFVEPPLAQSLMRELQDLLDQERREIHRILREMTDGLRPDAPILRGMLEGLVALDSLWARGLTAAAWGAHLPIILSPVIEAREGMVVVEGRHPLLLDLALAGEGHGEVIPFSLVLEPQERALVLSGPNTGGKTVFLKAMGLLPLLAQAGILPPVGEGTRLPLLQDVFADIGDGQSIAESLSTFSAHLVRAREILDQARPGMLVLMDEMGTGTDPAEGAALAQAILETLVARGVRALVTSHLGALKRLDTEGTGIVNGSLLFDSTRIAPTYQFQKGRPGRSYGLAIARRLGLPDGVLDRAETLVGGGELEVEALLTSLEEKERALTEALASAQGAQSRAEAMEARWGKEMAALDEAQKGAQGAARQEARQLLLEAREEVEAAIHRLEVADAEARAEAAREARARVEEAARRYQDPGEKKPRTRPRRGSAPPVIPFAVGQAVRLVSAGTRGTVQGVEEARGRVVVDVGGMRLTLPMEAVEQVQGGASPSRSAPSVRPERDLVELAARPEVHLLGLRVDDVSLSLGRALDAAVVAQLSSLRIVHGKGTGALRARVHELLEADPRVRAFRAGVHGEGGAGVTIAEIQ